MLNLTQDYPLEIQERHIESAMPVPSELAKLALVHGTHASEWSSPSWT
jgi:hypothetical protein